MIQPELSDSFPARTDEASLAVERDYKDMALSAIPRVSTTQRREPGPAAFLSIIEDRNSSRARIIRAFTQS